MTAQKDLKNKYGTKFDGVSKILKIIGIGKAEEQREMLEKFGPL